MEYLFGIFLLSIISALVGFGFKRMQDYDMILEWYGKWLEKLPYSERKSSPLEILETGKTQITHKSKFLYYLTKPLGRCIVCNTTWIGMFLAFIFFQGQPLLFISICIVGVASAGIVVLISNKYVLMQNAL